MNISEFRIREFDGRFIIQRSFVEKTKIKSPFWFWKAKNFDEKEAWGRTDEYGNVIKYFGYVLIPQPPLKPFCSMEDAEKYLRDNIIAGVKYHYLK